jgi:hypothetical protein
LINRSPQITLLAIHPYENPVQMPPSEKKYPILDTTFLDLSHKHQFKSMAPRSYYFAADVDATFMEQVVDLS